MVNIDALLSEWAYRCKKGYPDMDSPSDLRVLKTILKEQGISLPEFQEQVIVEEDERTSIEKDFEKFDDELDKKDIDPCSALKDQIADLIDDMFPSHDPNALNPLLVRCSLKIGSNLNAHVLPTNLVICLVLLGSNSPLATISSIRSAI